MQFKHLTESTIMDYVILDFDKLNFKMATRVISDLDNEFNLLVARIAPVIENSFAVPSEEEIAILIKLIDISTVKIQLQKKISALKSQSSLN